jgi:hypothetical protein
MHENKQFPARWTVDTMTELFDDTAAAKGSSASLTAKISAMDAEIAGKISSIPVASSSVLGGVKIGSGISVASDGTISASGGSGGTSDYTQLSNLPQINSVTLTGNKSSSDLGLASAADVATKADAATTLAGYGITDAKISNGVITLGSNTITPLTQHQDISGKADKATTIAGYGITDAKITSGTITLGSQSITPLTQHQDISGKADKATTLSGYGITDAKIQSGTITLGSQTITPLTQHQDISGKADKVEQEKDRAALVEIVDSGAKNLLKISGTSQTVSGVTFTVNSDGSISASGTATSDAVFNLTANLNLQSGSYVFSPGFPNGSSGSTFFCDIFNSGYSNRSVAYQERSIPDTTKIIRFIVANGYTANNITLFPMVCTAANRKISAAFVPYRPSYQELCDRVLNGGAS